MSVVMTIETLNIGKIIKSFRPVLKFESDLRMILSRAKSDSANSQQSGGAVAQKRSVPEFDDFILKRDYTGAKTIIEFDTNASKQENLTKQWKSFCDFHLGNYNQALEEYQSLQNIDNADIDGNEIAINIAVCMFYCGMYSESQEIIENIPNNPLKVRLLFHLAHKLKDEERLLELHGSLRDVHEDQLSLASMHFLRAHYQDAIDIYKRVLLDKKDYIALNIYLALCYYKLDYYDISLEVLDSYLGKYPDSIIAINLKACNRFRLANGRAAEIELKNFNGIQFGADLIKHNLVVFRNGEGALHVLPELVDIIPEARLNLSIHYLRAGDVNKAEMLLTSVQPSVPSEYILKGVVHTLLGIKMDSTEHLKNAQQYFHLVGGSASECDTIPGRQSMASAFFLYGQFEEVLVYMNSIRSFFVNNDTFNYNFAQAKAATGYYKEAEELLVQINDSDIRKQQTFNMVLAKCHILSGHAEQAWNLYLSKNSANSESFIMLQLIANECYRVGEYWVAAKAFDILEKFSIEPNPEFWEGKRGACVGALYSVITERNMGKPPNGMLDICNLLRESINPQAESMIRIIRKFCNDFN